MELEIPYELRKIYKDEGIDLIEYLPITNADELTDLDKALLLSDIYYVM